MFARSKKQASKNSSFALYCKCGATHLLLALSILVVACSSGNGATAQDAASFGSALVTVTIRTGDDGNVSPTPTLPPYWCGAWVTNASPAYDPNGVVGVYAKYTQNVNGNPQGVSGATATETTLWPDGSTTSESVTTTADGLAVFSISTANRAAAINKITLVTVMFQKAGLPPCTADADQAAFFTLVVVTPSASATKGSGSTGTGTPTGAPGPGGPGTPIVGPGTPTGTPQPTATKKPGH